MKLLLMEAWEMSSSPSVKFDFATMNAPPTLKTVSHNQDRANPRSPRERLGGYVLLSRLIDQCRAELEESVEDASPGCNTIGNSCFFRFKNLLPEEFKVAVSEGLTDSEMLQWVNLHGKPRSHQDILGWSAKMEQLTLGACDSSDDDYFIEECRDLGLDPHSIALFDWIEWCDFKNIRY